MLGARRTGHGRNNRLDASDESDVDEAQTADWMMDLHGTDEGAGGLNEADEPARTRAAPEQPGQDHPDLPSSAVLEQQQRRQQQSHALHRQLGAASKARPPRSAASQDQPSREWLIPLGVPPEKLFGKDQSIINSIEMQTNTYLKANIHPPAVFMWGTQEQMNEAARALEVHANHILDDLRANARRTKGWEKPEKPLSERKMRKEMLKKEKKDYHGTPPVEFSSSGVFVIPFPDIVRADWLRRPEVDPEIRKLREDTRCWIIFEDDDDGGQLRVIGEKPGDVEVCLSRLKNLFIQRTFKRRLSTLYMLECPSEGPSTRLKFERAPANLTRQVSSKFKSALTVIVRVSEAVAQGPLPATVTAEQIRINNSALLSANFKNALEDVRLWQGQTRIRVRFGHLICSDYPEPQKYPTWPAYRMSDKILPHHSFKAQFSRAVADSESQVDTFLKYLRDTCAEYADNPRDSYELLCCDRHGVAACESALREGQELPPEFGRYRVVVRFHKDGKLASWDAEEIGVPILKASNFSTNSLLDWRMDMCTSIPLPSDSKSPHAFMCWNLRLNIDRDRGERLIYHHTSHLAILEVVRKRTWTYAHGDWIIEVAREEKWPSVAPLNGKSDSKGMMGGAEHIDPQCTLKGTPARDFVSVQLHHRNWDEVLASQLKLGPGEPAPWDAEALCGPEACNALLREIQEVDENIRRFVESVP